MAFVYLLHFSEPYPAGRRPQHYLGVAADLEARFKEHQRGSSKGRLTRACREKGIAIMISLSMEFLTSDEAFNHERLVKRRKRSYKNICPTCAGAAPRTIGIGESR